MTDQVSIEVDASDEAITVEGFVVVGPSPTGDHNHAHGTLLELGDPDHPIAAVIGLQTALDGKEAAGTAASQVSAHAGAADPHTGYQKETEKAAANGYASLDATAKVPFGQLPTGTGGTQVAVGNHAHAAGTPGHTVEDEGVALTQRASLNFAGAGVTVTDTGSKTLVTIPGGGGGGSLAVQDEGTTVASGVTQIDFQGAGVTAAAGTGEVVVTIPTGITVQEGNVTEGTGITTLDFRGVGMDVVVTGSEAVVTVTDGVAGHAIANEGVFLTQRAGLDFTGAGVNVVDVGGVTVVDIPGATGGGGGYATIQDEGNARAQQTTLDVVGAGVSADEGTGKTLLVVDGYEQIIGAAGAIWPPNAAAANLACVLNTQYFMRVNIPPNRTGTTSLDRVNVNVVTGAPSATIRVALYYGSGGDPSSIVPGTEVSGTSAADPGMKYLNFAAPVAISSPSASRELFISIAIQGTGSVTVTGFTPVLASQLGPSFNVVTPAYAWARPNQSGAFTSFDYTGASTVVVPRMMVRRSS
jgi:hypothetical protein